MIFSAIKLENVRLSFILRFRNSKFLFIRFEEDYSYALNKFKSFKNNMFDVLSNRIIINMTL